MAGPITQCLYHERECWRGLPTADELTLHANIDLLTFALEIPDEEAAPGLHPHVDASHGGHCDIFGRIRWLAGRCGGITGLLGEFIKISWFGLDFEQEQQHANA